MASGKILIAVTLCILCAASLAENVKVCLEPETGTSRAPMISPPLANVVIGAGRLQ
jgi:hypothetical protein